MIFLLESHAQNDQRMSVRPPSANATYHMMERINDDVANVLRVKLSFSAFPTKSRQKLHCDAESRLKAAPTREVISQT
jgi:hypothetical protein